MVMAARTYTRGAVGRLLPSQWEHGATYQGIVHLEDPLASLTYKWSHRFPRKTRIAIPLQPPCTWARYILDSQSYRYPSRQDPPDPCGLEALDVLVLHGSPRAGHEDDPTRGCALAGSILGHHGARMEEIRDRVGRQSMDIQLVPDIDTKYVYILRTLHSAYPFEALNEARALI